MAFRQFLRNWGFATSALIIFFIVVANYFISLPYFIFSPGSVRGVGQYIELPEDKAFPARGDVMLTTVSLQRAKPFDMLWAYITPNNRIEHEDETLGDQSQDEFLRLAEQAMDNSKQTAIAVAMRRAGHEVRQVGDGARVVEVIPGSPADGKLAPGEVITRIDGNPAEIGSDVTQYVRSRAPGSTLNLQVSGTDGATRLVDVTTAERPDGTQGVYVGVLITTHNPDIETPFPVNVQETDIGGPSAGLAFSLSVLDYVTPGELTGGRDVAVTGTITADGTVGPVGGVEQKVAAVNRTEASLFLVPPQELEQAKGHADSDLEVVAVGSFDEAVAALAARGGDVSGLPQAGAPLQPAA